MAALRFALVCALGTLLLTPPGAVGGGWWSSIDPSRSTVAPGERVVVDAVVTFSSNAAAEEERESNRFYVYLLRDFDYTVVERAMRHPAPRGWWSLGDAEAIQVGEVSLNVTDTNLSRARAEFTVPELPPATYHVMFCDTACTDPLADVIPAKGFVVVADPATARLTERVDRLEQQSQHQAGQLDAARGDLDRARGEARNARSELEELEGRVSSVAAEGQSEPLAARWEYAGWLLAGALGGALAVLVLRRGRSRPSQPTRAPEWDPSEEELRELLSSEAEDPR
jgi:hypothetical protein